MNVIIFNIIFGLIVVVDIVCYIKAKYPETSENFLYKLPFGGIIALIKLGGNK